jgi:hypothetical protein
MPEGSELSAEPVGKFCVVVNALVFLGAVEPSEPEDNACTLLCAADAGTTLEPSTT